MFNIYKVINVIHYINTLEEKSQVMLDTEKSFDKNPTSLLGIYPKDATSYYRVTCSSMFITILFVIA